MPIPGVNRAVIQAINVARSIDDDVRAVYITDDPESATQVRARLRATDPGRPAGRRRVAVPGARRPAARLPRRPRRRLAARTGTAHHVRRHPRVRRAQLVGTDPLQPGRQAAALGPARAAAHGRRQRAVPPRGPGPVRSGRCGGEARRRTDRRPSAVEPARRPRATLGGRWYRDEPCPMLEPPPTSASSSPSTVVRATRGSSASAADSTPRQQGGAHRHPRRRDRLDAAARRRHRRTLRGGPARPRHGRGGRRRARSSGWSRSCSRPVTSARRSSTRPTERGADLIVLGRPVPDAVRWRVRHRPDHPLRPAERAVYRVGRARTHARGGLP